MYFRFLFCVFFLTFACFFWTFFAFFCNKRLVCVFLLFHLSLRLTIRLVEHICFYTESDSSLLNCTCFFFYCLSFLCYSLVCALVIFSHFASLCLAFNSTTGFLTYPTSDLLAFILLSFVWWFCCNCCWCDELILAYAWVCACVYRYTSYSHNN